MAAIDFEIDRFFNSRAEAYMDISNYKRWCSTYESFNYPKWTTKDGKKVKLSDMSPEHLENTIKLVQRKDPTNGWLNILKQEKTYRGLKKKIQQLENELSETTDMINNIL